MVELIKLLTFCSFRIPEGLLAQLGVAQQRENEAVIFLTLGSIKSKRT